MIFVHSSYNQKKRRAAGIRGSPGGLFGGSGLEVEGDEGAVAVLLEVGAEDGGLGGVGEVEVGVAVFVGGEFGDCAHGFGIGEAGR